VKFDPVPWIPTATSQVRMNRMGRRRRLAGSSPKLSGSKTAGKRFRPGATISMIKYCNPTVIRILHLMYCDVEALAANIFAEALASRNRESVSATSSNPISVFPDSRDRIAAGVSS